MDHEKLRQYLDDNREPEGKGCAILLAWMAITVIAVIVIFVLSLVI